MNLEIRNMVAEDAEKVLEIYQQGIETGLATFETELPDWESWNSDHYEFSRFVMENENDEIIGWCALKPYSKRECYSGVAEVSIYIRKDFQKLGLGRILLEKLVLDSEEHGIWTLQAGIISDNKASISLHQKVGFRIVGIREKIAKCQNEWKDVTLMEKRSKKIG